MTGAQGADEAFGDPLPTNERHIVVRGEDSRAAIDMLLAFLPDDGDWEVVVRCREDPITSGQMRAIRAFMSDIGRLTGYRSDEVHRMVCKSWIPWLELKSDDMELRLVRSSADLGFHEASSFIAKLAALYQAVDDGADFRALLEGALTERAPELRATA